MNNACGVVGLAEGAAETIRNDICDRRLKPGELIGTEQQLAASLRLSRNALREALGRLRGLGLVSSCQGKGVFVAQADPAETLGLIIPQYVVDHATFAELVALRCSLEIGAIGLAVKNATEADIERLKKLGQESVRVASDPEATDEMVWQTDIEFHKAVLSATQSALLAGMHRVIVAFFRRGPQETGAWLAVGDPNQSHHVQIAEAFAARNVERARQVLTAHFIPYLGPPAEEGKTV